MDDDPYAADESGVEGENGAADNGYHASGNSSTNPAFASTRVGGSMASMTSKTTSMVLKSLAEEKLNVITNLAVSPLPACLAPVSHSRLPILAPLNP